MNPKFASLTTALLFALAPLAIMEVAADVSNASAEGGAGNVAASLGAPAAVGEPYALEATGDSSTSDPLVCAWAIDQQPPGGSATIDDAAACSTSITPDAPGLYVLTVTVDDGSGNSDDADLQFMATEEASALPPSCSSPLDLIDNTDCQEDFQAQFNALCDLDDMGSGGTDDEEFASCFIPAIGAGDSLPCSDGAPTVTDPIHATLCGLFGTLNNSPLDSDLDDDGEPDAFGTSVAIAIYPGDEDADEDGLHDRFFIGLYRQTNDGPDLLDEYSRVGVFGVQMDFFHTADPFNSPFDATAPDFDYSVTPMIYDPRGDGFLHGGNAYRLSTIFEHSSTARYGAEAFPLAIYSPAENVDGGLCVVCIGSTHIIFGDGEASEGIIELMPEEGGDYPHQYRQTENPTLLFIDVFGENPIVNGLTFHDGQPLNLDDTHIKLPAFSDLDDDGSSDTAEFLICGSNPKNRASDCEDFDGDGKPNGADPNPVSPDVDLTLAYATDPASGGEETPYVPDLEYTCSGTIDDLILQSQTDGGAWVDLDASLSDPCGVGSAAPLGNNAPVLNAADATKSVAFRLKATTPQGGTFVSDATAAATILGNAKPTATAFTITCDSSTATCTDATDPNPSRTFIHTVTGVGTGGDSGQTNSVRLTGFDFGTADGTQPLTLSDQGGGVWSATYTYAGSVGTPPTLTAEVRDSGGALNNDLTETFTFVVPAQALPVVAHDPSAQQAETPLLGLEIEASLTDADAHAFDDDIGIVLHFRQGDGAWDSQEMFIECGSGTVQFAPQDALGCDGSPDTSAPIFFYGAIPLDGSADSVEYYFVGYDPDDNEGPLGSDVAPFTYEPEATPSADPDEVCALAGKPDGTLPTCLIPEDSPIGILIGLLIPECRGEDPPEFCADPTDQRDLRDTDDEPSNDQEGNGQVDFVEERLLYTKDNGRLDVYIVADTAALGPEKARIYVSDQADDNIIALIDIYQEETVVCFWLDDEAGNHPLRFGFAADGETACGESDTVWNNGINGAGTSLGGQLGSSAGIPAGDRLPLFEFVDEDGDSLPETLIINLIDPSSCGPSGSIGPVPVGGVTCTAYLDPIPVPLFGEGSGGPDLDPVLGAINDAACSIDSSLGQCGTEGDEDGDGVPDEDDLCPDTPDGATVDEDGCADGQTPEGCAEGETEAPVVGECVPDPTSGGNPTDPIVEIVEGCVDDGDCPADPETILDALCGDETDPGPLSETPICGGSGGVSDDDGDGVPDEADQCPGEDDLGEDCLGGGGGGVEISCDDDSTAMVRICMGGNKTLLNELTGGVWPGAVIWVAGIPIVV